MELKCPRCKTINEITWQIKGFGLLSAAIHFKCTKCKVDAELIISFYENKQPETEVKFGDTNYIG